MKREDLLLPCNNLSVGRTTLNTSSTCNVFFFLQRDRTVLDCTARISCPRPSPISKRSHPVSAYEVLIHLCLKSVCIPATTRDSSATEACTSIQISLVSHLQHIICFYHLISVFLHVLNHPFVVITMANNLVNIYLVV